MTWLSRIHVPETGLGVAVVTDTLPTIWSGNIGLDGNFMLYDAYKNGTKLDSCFIDIGDDIAGTEYDVAHVKWGGSWHIPTDTEFEELMTNCTFVWTKLNNVSGYRFTGPNGRNLFIPAGTVHTGTNSYNKFITFA